jgi:iron-sulfur cluster assembly 2
MPTRSNCSHSQALLQQLRKISQREKPNDVALRIAVEAGGCHGYQYKMDLVYISEGRQPED